MHVQVLMFNQDDPKKCSAARLVKFGLAQPVKKIQNNTIVLDPFSKNTLFPHERETVSSILAVDCSWNYADKTFTKKFTGIPKKLPPLLAGNPINYSKLNKLSTVEALSAAAYILGYVDLANEMLSKFKWGHTFLELNKNLLDEYEKISSEEDVLKILKEFGLLL